MNLPVRSLRHRILPAEVRERAGVLSVFSSQSRQGDWNVPRELRVPTVLGSVELDLREARLPEGETRIHIFALLGSVELLLPPGVRIEVEGDGLAASFDIMPDSTVPVPPGAPTIRVTGGAYMASVEGRVRFAGESEREARKRIKTANRGG